ncbi:hypothetical protein H4R20_007261, partial [Coemansia guatemalensis]
LRHLRIISAGLHTSSHNSNSRRKRLQKSVTFSVAPDALMVLLPVSRRQPPMLLLLKRETQIDMSGHRIRWNQTFPTLRLLQTAIPVMATVSLYNSVVEGMLWISLMKTTGRWHLPNHCSSRICNRPSSSSRTRSPILRLPTTSLVCTRIPLAATAWHLTSRSAHQSVRMPSQPIFPPHPAPLNNNSRRLRRPFLRLLLTMPRLTSTTHLTTTRCSTLLHRLQTTTTPAAAMLATQLTHLLLLHLKNQLIGLQSTLIHSGTASTF